MTEHTNLPVRIEGLRKAFGSKQVLDGVDLVLEPGKVTALLGQNGSGKTTLIKSILGLLRPDAGSVNVFGVPAGAEQARLQQGVMLQDVDLPPLLTVRELLTLFRMAYARPMAEEEVLEATQLAPILKARYGNLSGGEKRRVQCALALCGNPRLLVLDEPTTHMDEYSKEIFWNAVYRMRKRECTVLIVSHHRDEIRVLADRILQLEAGRISADVEVGRAATGAHYARVSFAQPAALDIAQLGSQGCVVSIREVGRMTEAIVTDVAAFIALLGAANIPIADLVVEPVRDIGPGSGMGTVKFFEETKQ